ncbi:MAG TPA: thiamine pyrophosphate-dependent dehydrogenase E1 component subunit alpha [Terriglobia bacterium]|nr:thiamine pyrophosphate-dependent dehydrogenase E1 component subunit alpha [Terriglobia bacterium]
MAIKLTSDQIHDLYYYMRLNRRVDEQLSTLYRQGKVVGGVYSSLGQEAISVAAAYALQPEDFLGGMIRNVGAMLVRGFRPRDVFMQYMARVGGPTAGRDANTHFGDLQRGVVAPISMLGELVPVLAGIGLAAKIRGEKRVALTFVGDGAMSTTPVHEGLNFAAVKRLPLVLIVENNGWAYSTPVSKQSATYHLASRAKAYGIPSRVIEGNVALKVYEATAEAAEWARHGHGPTLIECKTMRMKGHAEHDDARYVPREQLVYWQNLDPIALFKRAVKRKKLMTKEEWLAIDERVEQEVREDLEAAEASPFPPPEGAARPVYSIG